MIPAILCLAIVGLACGLFLVHWFRLAFLGILLSVALVLIAQRDLMLIPKWLACLTALQLPYLAGALLRLWWEDRELEREQSSAPAGEGVQPGSMADSEGQPRVPQRLPEDVRPSRTTGPARKPRKGASTGRPGRRSG